MRFSRRSIRLAHDAHVMPEMPSSRCAVRAAGAAMTSAAGDDVVAGLGDGGPHGVVVVAAGHRDAAAVEVDLDGLDAGDPGHLLLDRADAVPAAHALDEERAGLGRTGHAPILPDTPRG